MAKNADLSGFTTAQTKSETAMDKTARAVKEIKDADAKQREDKITRLRKARHESEAEAKANPAS
ncbi:hypothetical protein [Yoonia sp.]|uniref:hypothetical protein n=1 Tax=Yoonia sp. TaxID=2212373 RepID=UPI00391D226A